MKISKLFLGRKSDISARKIIFYGVAALVLVVAFFLIVWLVSSGKSNISKIPEGLENYLITQRFLNSPSCFIFQDKDTGRAYPGIIDLKKFNQEYLNKCYDTKDTNVKAYRLSLSYEDNKITISTKNWEGFLKKGETKQVFVREDDKITKAELFIETQNAK